MSAYAFKIDLDGNAVKGMQQMQSEAEKLHSKTKEIHGSFGKLGESVKELANEFKGLALGALGIGSMFAGFEFIKSSKEAFDKFEESVTKVEAALTSTGHSAGLSLEEISDEAKKLSGQTLFNKAALLDGQSMLLTFTQIKGAVFNEAIPAITDFATRYHMEMADAALQVGKALNDPEKGIHRLTRMGVVFSKQQEEQIKHFMSINDVASAQRVMLGELNTEFGGLAKAMTTTDEGKFLVGLIPAFNAVVNIAKEFKNWITGDSDSAYIFKEVLAVISIALAGYLVYVTLISTATKIWTAFQWALNVAMTANPIGLVVIAVVALIAGIAALWDKCEGFRKVVGGIFAEIAKVIMGVVHIFTNFAHMVGNVFTGHFKEAGQAGKNMIADFKKDFTQGWGDAWDKGAEKAKNSKFKFGGLIGLTGDKKAGEHAGMHGIGSAGAAAQSAINTSLLSGASGGLGEAKIIHIDFHAPLMKIDIPGGNGKDVVDKAPLAMEQLIRITNNLSQSQGSTF